MIFSHAKCKLCGLTLTTIAVPRRLAKAVDVLSYRPIRNVYDWVEREICICCDLVGGGFLVCQHRKVGAPGIDERYGLTPGINGPYKKSDEVTG